MKTIEQQYELAILTLGNDKDMYAGHDLAIKYNDEEEIVYAFFGVDLDGDLFYKGYASERVENEEKCWTGSYDTHEIMFNDESELAANRRVPSDIVILEA